MAELVFVAGCVIPAFLVSVLMTRLMISWAPYCGLVDLPAERKVHEMPTPLGGGLGIVLGVILPLAFAQLLFWAMGQGWLPSAWLPERLQPLSGGALYRAPQLWAILAAGALLATTGLIDDVRNLSWKFRLAVQFLVAIAVVSSGIRATVFVGDAWFGSVVSVFWIVLLINSLNFLDNMDGLTGGISLIAATMFAAIMLTQTAEPRWLVSGMLLVIAGACSGFLVWNWTPARIFMGDCGSTFLGLMLACLTLLGTFYDESASGTHVMLAPLCVMAVPLYDFTSVMVIRLKRGLSPFKADKNHFSHRLTDLGLTRKNAVLTIHLCTITTGLAALLLFRIPDWGSAAIVLALVGCVLWVIAILETAGRRAARKRETSAETPEDSADEATTA